MANWQVRAGLANGAVAMFGLDAGNDEAALDAAHELLEETGQPAVEIEVAQIRPRSRAEIAAIFGQ